MQLVITSNGSYLHEKQGLFEVRTPERCVEVSAVKVTSIVIGSASSLSTGAIRLAVENNIDILFLDKFGDPFARAWHCGFGSTAAIRREQMRWAESAEEESGSWPRLPPSSNNSAISWRSCCAAARLNASGTRRP